MFKELNLYTDGCSKSNPGQAGAGVLIITTNQQILVQNSYPIGIRTNNEAEYLALLLGLTEVEKLGKCEKLNIFSDSQLMVNQINGKFKIKESRLKALYEKSLKSLKGVCQTYVITHIPREQNNLADELANKAIIKEKK